MKSLFTRIAAAVVTIAVALTVLVNPVSDAKAGLATSVGLVADLSYSGSIDDLIGSFRLIERVTGRVVWQADPGDITVVRPTPGVVRFSTTLVAGDWNYDSDYEWSCRIDARDATSSVYWTSFVQNVDSTQYTSTVPTIDIQNRVSEALLFGQVEDSYL